jgi:hypothetical protein
VQEEGAARRRGNGQGAHAGRLGAQGWRTETHGGAGTRALQGRTVLHFLVVVCSTREGHKQVRASGCGKGTGGGAQGDDRETQRREGSGTQSLRRRCIGKGL